MDVEYCPSFCFGESCTDFEWILNVTLHSVLVNHIYIADKKKAYVTIVLDLFFQKHDKHGASL
jgi:hypothetical protein